MLSMNECLPDPDWEYDILPALYLNVIMIVISHSFRQKLFYRFFAVLLAWILFVFKLLEHLLKLLLTLLVILIVKCILNLN